MPASSTSKTTASHHVHCTCITPPSLSTFSQYSVALSPKKKKVQSEVPISSELPKRQLFKDSDKMEKLVDAKQLMRSGGNGSNVESVVPGKAVIGAVSTPATSHTAASSGVVVASSALLVPPSHLSLPSTSQMEVKLEDENVAKKPEIKSRHPCTLCSKCFNTPGKLNQHMFSHTGEKPFVCNHCSKAFSSKFKLVRHILIHSDLRQYRCTVCERTFHRKDHLKNHSKVHSPIKRRFKCDRPDCGKEYSSILSYRKHIAVHSAEEGNLECKICGKKFETKEETLFHLKVHAGSRSLKTPADRKYHCDHCDRSFFTGKDVRRHLVVHTGRRDFLCQYCPQRFGRKDHLTRHIKKSHSNSAKKTKTKKQIAVTVLASATSSSINTNAEVEKSESIDNILIEMFDKSACPSTSSNEPNIGGDTDDLYKMQGLDSPVDVMKLESSPDIIPIVTIHDKTSLSASQQPSQTKVEEDLSIYQMPMLNADIPFNKFEQYQFEDYSYDEEAEPVAGPSSSAPVIPELIYHSHAHTQHHHHHHHHPHHHQQQQPPSHQQPPQPAPYPPELAGPFVTEDDNNIKVESDFVTEGQTSTLDLVLPPITNISPSMSNCLLMNPDFQNLLSSAAAAAAVAQSSSTISNPIPVQDSDNGNNNSTNSHTRDDGSNDMDRGGNSEVVHDTGDSSRDEDEVAAAAALFNFLPTSTELFASLLSPDSQTNSTPLPGFNQAFHQPP